MRRAAASAAFAIALSASPARASESAREVATRTIDEVFVVLRATVGNTVAARNERLARLRKVVDKVFDWREMARRSLGVHWRGATDEQRQRFVAVFQKLLADQYLEDMDKFRGTETVVVKAAIDTGRYTVVKSILTTYSRDTVPIDYTMRQIDGRWWIHDISIEGVSMVNHYRKTFARFLVNNSLDALLARLEARNP